MGREVKRVALDFNWPLNKVWGGFLNPFYSQSLRCPQCCGSGQSPEAKRLSDQWYGKASFQPSDRGSTPWTPSDPQVRVIAERNMGRLEFYDDGAIVREASRLCYLWNRAWSHHLNANDVAALIAGGRLLQLTHTSQHGSGLQPKNPPYIPTPHEVNAWSLSKFGHDSINSWICVTAECERRGWNKKCVRCGGGGTIWPTPEIEKQADDWQRVEPPTGDGYQLWETVSEGSPISPVFKTAEELADWLATSPDYTWRTNDEGTTRDQWLKFILGPGWAPSFIGSERGLESGVIAVTR